MSEEENTLALLHIEQKIFSIRGMQVMLDSDLAELYGVETKVLNQAVKRNIERFPERFRFQLSMGEMRELVTNCDRLSRLKHSATNPYAFTEQGVSMLSSVLRSEAAIAVSIRIMDAFVEMRRLFADPLSLIKRFEIIDLKLSDTDIKFEKIFQALETRHNLPETGIFFEGQVFDAWVFISDLGRKWFAFSKIDTLAPTILQRLTEPNT